MHGIDEVPTTTIHTASSKPMGVVFGRLLAKGVLRNKRQGVAVALKKSELYSSLWSGCDELRGGMDASQYKDYVLVLLFIKYISDKYLGLPYAPIIIPEGASFKDMVALKGTPDIGDQINKRIIASDAAPDRNRRGEGRGCRGRCLTEAGECLVDGGDQGRKFRGWNLVAL
jgi:hypothetical protein